MNNQKVFEEIKKALNNAAYDDGHGYDIVDMYDALSAIADILGVEFNG